jgi:threonine dehydrogenase-like Zn-dependent dehydrogenase
MRQVVMYTAGDVRVEEREDPKIIEPTDAIVRLTASCICGSDLWPYRGVEPADHQAMGHEYVGVVEEIGSQVTTLKVGDFVVGSFVISDNTCELCQAGYPSMCVCTLRSWPRRSVPSPSGPGSRWRMGPWSPPRVSPARS